jgi:hypothetical protein
VPPQVLKTWLQATDPNPLGNQGDGLPLEQAAAQAALGRLRQQQLGAAPLADGDRPTDPRQRPASRLRTARTALHRASRRSGHRRDRRRQGRDPRREPGPQPAHRVLAHDPSRRPDRPLRLRDRPGGSGALSLRRRLGKGCAR